MQMNVDAAPVVGPYAARQVQPLGLLACDAQWQSTWSAGSLTVTSI
jgi:hypothetical protein